MAKKVRIRDLDQEVSDALRLAALGEQGGPWPSIRSSVTLVTQDDADYFSTGEQWDAER